MSTSAIIMLLFGVIIYVGGISVCLSIAKKHDKQEQNTSEQIISYLKKHRCVSCEQNFMLCLTNSNDFGAGFLSSSDLARSRSSISLS